MPICPFYVAYDMRKKWEKSLHKRDILNLCSDNMSLLCSKPYGKYRKIFPKRSNNKLDIMASQDQSRFYYIKMAGK